MREIEVIVDKWPIGPQNTVASQGDRFFLEDEAARILVGMGKVKYLDSSASGVQSREMSAEESEAASKPSRGRHRRRDMRAQD